jgi:hypothetical protein
MIRLIRKAVFMSILEVDKNTQLELFEMPYKRFLQTDYWKEVRRLVFEKYGKQCEVCKSEKDIHLHHFDYENLGKEKYDDLVPLCESCHFTLHDSKGFIPAKYAIFNRESLKIAIDKAEEAKKILDNQQYIRLLPLTKKQLWTANCISEFWELPLSKTEKALKKYTKYGIVSWLELPDQGIRYYSINRFMWYLIEFDFPKFSKAVVL